MESNISTYKLEQNGKEYIFTTSIVGDLLRLSCKNSSSSKSKKFYRDFSIEQLQKIDKLFNVLKTPLQGTEYIDQALRQQKVGVSEEYNCIKITFYITTKGITNQIDIPLWDSKGSKMNFNGNNISKNEKIENYNINDINNFDINIPDTNLNTNNYEQYIQSDYNNQYNTDINLNNLNVYTNEQNIENIQNVGDADLNKYFNAGTTTTMNTETRPYITAADDNENTNQYFQQYEGILNTNTSDINQYTNELEGIQLNDNNKNNNLEYDQYLSKDFAQVEPNQILPVSSPITEVHPQGQYQSSTPMIQSPRPKIQEIEENTINIQTPANVNANFDEQIKQILEQDSNNNIINTQAEEKEINQESKPLTTTKVLPVKTTTRVLPPIGPFISLEGLDLHKLGMMNSEHQKMPPFEQIINTNETDTNINQNQINQYIETKPNFITTEGETKTITNYKSSSNINTSNIDNINVVRKISASASKKNTNNTIMDTQTQKMINNIKNENVSLKRQLFELRNSFKINQENASITKSQLDELENLRKKVSEIEILRGQLTELNSLRAQVAEYNAIKGQLKEINLLKEKIKNQNNEINELKYKLKDYENLKSKIIDLEGIKQKYEKDIKVMKESLRLYSIKTNIREEKDDKDDKDIDEDTPEEITVKGDIIHDTNELELITKKINKNNQKLTLNLLYKATADSDKAAAFHAKCDEAKSSIVLVETDKGKRFGGYTTCSWSGDCIDKKDEDAFVFSLDKMKTYDNIPGEEAVGCYPKFGPIFLGCQIRIYDEAFTRGGTTFERGMNFDTEEDYELTGGDRVYNVKEIEVYEVVIE